MERNTLVLSFEIILAGRLIIDACDIGQELQPKLIGYPDNSLKVKVKVRTFLTSHNS